jgi:Replication-relaxation
VAQENDTRTERIVRTNVLSHPQTDVETTRETVSIQKSPSHQTNPASPAPRLRQTPSFHRRLPRFHRAKGSHRPPLALQPRDLELLRTAHDYRLLTTVQYLQLFNDESRDGLYRRLQKLFHHGYLDRIGTNPNAPMLYALAKRGADVLEVFARKDVGDRYVAHQLMIGDFRIALTLAARQQGITLAWRPFPQSPPVRPDGFFSLQFRDLPDGRNRAFFMLEADRSTMPRERFVEKLRAYEAWRMAGGHTSSLGIRSFRVLTVTKSVERMRGILRATAADARLASRNGAYWFTAVHEYGADFEILGRVWYIAGDSGLPTSLLPT